MGAASLVILLQFVLFTTIVPLLFRPLLTITTLTQTFYMNLCRGKIFWQQ